MAIDRNETAIYIMSDSQISIDACVKHYRKDPEQDWCNRDGTQVSNQGVIKRIYELYADINVIIVFRFNF